MSTRKRFSRRQFSIESLECREVLTPQAGKLHVLILL